MPNECVFTKKQDLLLELDSCEVLEMLHLVLVLYSYFSLQGLQD